MRTNLASPASLNTEHWIGYWPPGSLDPPATLLFCFPYAGGAASIYRDWHTVLSPDIRPIPVLLPGRDSRWREPAYTDHVVLTADLASVLPRILRPPYALFGHSMGALIAFELARALRRAGCDAPRRLFVSGCRAPHLPDREEPAASKPDREFLEELKRLDGIPAEVLDNSEFMQLMLPLLRADFRLFEAYAYEPDDPLDCPISAFAGADDRRTTPDDVRAWRTHTRGAFVARVLAGDHFFLRRSRAELSRAIREDLDSS